MIKKLTLPWVRRQSRKSENRQPSSAFSCSHLSVRHLRTPRVKKGRPPCSTTGITSYRSSHRIPLICTRRITLFAQQTLIAHATKINSAFTWSMTRCNRAYSHRKREGEPLRERCYERAERTQRHHVYTACEFATGAAYSLIPSRRDTSRDAPGG